MNRSRARRAWRPLLAWTLAIFVTIAFTGMGLVNASGQDADSQPPSTPGSLIAQGGTVAPVVTHLEWSASSDNVGVTGYSIWRASAAGGPFESIATTGGVSFDDEAAVPGPEYWYLVKAFDAGGNVSDPSSIVGPVRATWLEMPHGNYPKDTDACAMCHRAHTATANGLTPTQSALCLQCHNGQGAKSDLANNRTDSLSLASGHSLEETESNPDLTNDCVSCHDPHRDPAQAPMIPNRVVNRQYVLGDGPQWCLTCHDDNNSWYGSGYPSVTRPSRDDSGYPTLGTFPGETAYLGSTNAHDRIPESTQTVASGSPIRRSTGDCLYCHAAHRGPNAYDGLRLTFRPPSASTLASDQAEGTYASLCFECHGGVVPSGFTTAPANVKQFVTAPDSFAGHRINTAGGKLPVGSPLPCYDCHGAHGSKRSNGKMLSDALGQSLDTSTPDGVRKFCFTCHTSGDFTKTSWDSVEGTYTAASTTATVEGIARTGGLLGLPPRDGHLQADTQSCYDCHGDDYASGGSNVHNPTIVGGVTVSAGGTECYTCHSALQTFLEDDLGAKVGISNTAGYHHVLGSAGLDGDTSFAAGAYPGAGTDVYCLSCHVDHDKFNSNNGANLRADLSPSSESTNTDFDPDTGGGVCIGCHSVALAKDTLNQKSGVTTTTPAIDGAAYARSPHNYSVTSTFNTGFQFGANCVKCHSDEQTKSFQRGPNEFATHVSLWDRILMLIGVAPPDTIYASDANACGNCHGGGRTQDFYGAASMTTTSTSVWSEFQMAGSSHPVTSTLDVHRSDETTDAPRHVVCEDCHDAHTVQPGVHTPQTAGSMAGRVLWGVTGYQPTYPAFASFEATSQYSFDTANESGVPTEFTRTVITSATPEAFLCIRCHSKSLAPATWPAAVTTKSGTYAPTDIAAEFSPANASGHNVFGDLTSWPRTDFGTVAGVANVRWDLPPSDSSWLKPGWSTSGTGSMVQCSDCHTNSGASEARGPHGSTAKWLVDPSVEGSATGDYASAYLSNTGISGNPICVKCHESGTSFLSATNSVHGRSNHRGSGNGKCINCHTRVPHAWKRPRMLAYTTDPAGYASLALRGVKVDPNTSSTGIAWRQSDCQSSCHGGLSGTVWP